MLANAQTVALVALLIMGCTFETITAWRECQPIEVVKGFNYFNCSGEDFTHLPDIPDEAQVLDFTRNSLEELPVILESKECNIQQGRCPVGTEARMALHCRYAISVSGNQISSFHAHALHNLVCLQSLDMSYNNIESTALSTGTFQEGVYHLESLILQGNPLGKLPDNIIDQPFMPRLKYLDLSYCQLREIGESSVDDHWELETLDLSHNDLTDIKHATFKGLNKLRVLDLSYNKLLHLGHQVFADLTGLDSLRLGHNQIQTFARHAFYGDSQLKAIDVSFNDLREIPYESLQELAELSILIINSNPMEDVSGKNSSIVLQSITNLHIDAMTRLSSLQRDALKSFPSLTTLSLRRNKKLTSIHPEFLGVKASRLKNAYLDQSGLSSLPNGALPWKQMSMIVLNGNPWRCDYTIEWMIHATAIPANTVLCDTPAQYQGQDIKTIDPARLQKIYPLTFIFAIIGLALSIPVVVLSVYVLWKKRRHFRCCSIRCRGSMQGRYFTVFTKDEDGGEEVDIEVNVNRRRLQVVSNGHADDTQPFITLEQAMGEDDDDDIDFKYDERQRRKKDDDEEEEDLF